MNTDHLITRAQLKTIPKRSTFNELLDDSTLSDIDKTILRLHYLEHKNLAYIGDCLGYSESTVKSRHRKAIKKLRPIL